MIDEGLMQKEIEKPYRARVKKTLYITGELHHRSDCELISKEEAEELVSLYVKEGTMGMYYPEDKLLVTDDYEGEGKTVHDEYGIGPEDVERMIACECCGIDENAIFLQGLCKHCFVTLAAEAQAWILIDEDPHNATQILAEVLTVFAYGKEDEMVFSTAIGKAALNTYLKIVKGDVRLCKHYDQIKEECLHKEGENHHGCNGELGECVVEKYKISQVDPKYIQTLQPEEQPK